MFPGLSLTLLPLEGALSALSLTHTHTVSSDPSWWLVELQRFSLTLLFCPDVTSRCR